MAETPLKPRQAIGLPQRRELKPVSQMSPRAQAAAAEIDRPIQVAQRAPAATSQVTQRTGLGGRGVGGALGAIGTGMALSGATDAVARSNAVQDYVDYRNRAVAEGGEDETPVWVSLREPTQPPAPAAPPKTPLPSRRGDVEDWLAQAQAFAKEGNLTTMLGGYAEGETPISIARENIRTEPVYMSRAPVAEPQAAGQGALPARPTIPEALPVREETPGIAELMQGAEGLSPMAYMRAMGVMGQYGRELANKAATDYGDKLGRIRLKREGEESAAKRELLGAQAEEAKRQVSALGPLGMSPLQEAQMNLYNAQAAAIPDRIQAQREQKILALEKAMLELDPSIDMNAEKIRRMQEYISVLREGGVPEEYEIPGTEVPAERTWYGGTKKEAQPAKRGFRAKQQDRSALGQPTYGIRG